MSMAEKNRKHGNNKGESKAHSNAHKYDARKMASVVNHNHFVRNHPATSHVEDAKK